MPRGNEGRTDVIMRKGILLSVFAVVLVGAIVGAIWYINEDGKIRAGGREAFIPYNSAIVVTVNENAVPAPEIETAFAEEIQAYRRRLLSQVADTLAAQGYVQAFPCVAALRLEGKNRLSMLYVADSKTVLSRNEVADFLNDAFGGKQRDVRKFDKHRIYTLRRGKETVYFAVCESMVLMSDSDLYVEDGLKQFDLEVEGKAPDVRYQNLGKYFSAGAGVNVFLNTEAFTDVLPLYVRVKDIFPQVDVSKFFKWGALDGEFGDDGLCFNGFLNYEGVRGSYLSVLKSQQPREPVMDAAVPARAAAFGMLSLSDMETYFTALDAYRQLLGKRESTARRRQQLERMFGKGREKELRDLLQGEFAVADLSFDATRRERDGLIIAGLKSGSLCGNWLANVMKAYAGYSKKELAEEIRTYRMDREKTFEYYRFPVEDMATLYWGEIFGGIPVRYALVQDNYLVFASSERAMKAFMDDYIHGSFVKDADWYQQLRTKLSGKYNVNYFARIADMQSFYQSVARGGWQKWLEKRDDAGAVFTALAWQGSNEGGMLYNTLFLSTEKLEDKVRPHMLWQTKLEAPVRRKPVPVVNHVTGEKELFVQDERHTVYLINDAGRVLWKQPTDGEINSEVYQVDAFKNGKLQYLFSTSERMYLIDRNGKAVGKFPVAFRAGCKQGISVFDYDNDRNYRIFAPCEDQEVYLYGLDGNEVKGWDCRKADKPIVTKVYHFRIGDKDYVVYADRYRLYILDRKGNERVPVSVVFDLKDHTDIYLTRKGDEPLLTFANATGPLNLVDFKGRLQTVKCDGLTAVSRVNVADMDGDGKDEYVITNGNRLAIYHMTGRLSLEKKWEASELGYPYLYRFAPKDSRIGLLDRESGRIYLVKSDGEVTDGFPIPGDSPFSIVFYGREGFYLYAGADNGTVIKYKVQR